MSEQLDHSALKNMLDVIGGDTDDLKELVDDFLNIANELTAEMKSAYEEGDANRLRIAAHTLKSNARDFGATTLSGHCAALEDELRENDVVCSEEQIVVIKTAAESAVAQLATFDVTTLS